MSQLENVTFQLIVIQKYNILKKLCIGPHKS
jgi:hypothetical protein